MHRIVPAIFLLFGAVIIGLVYLKPQWEDFSALKNKVDRLGELDRKLDLLGEARDKLQEAIAAIPENAKMRLTQALPEGADARGLLILMEERAQRDGILLQGITLETRKESGPQAPQQPRPAGVIHPALSAAIKELPFQLSLRGTYETMKRFLATLENSLRLLDITNVAFQAPGQDNTINFNINARAYHQ